MTLEEKAGLMFHNVIPVGMDGELFHIVMLHFEGKPIGLPLKVQQTMQYDAKNSIYLCASSVAS